METIKAYISNRTYRIRILLGSLFAAIIADGIITNHLVHGNLAREANPFLEYWVVEDKLLFIKILGGLLAAIYIWNLHRRHPKLAISLSLLFLSGYTAIICWNILILV
jgi:phosphoglycerol transferase MdoB-like AlkP superfamily enzyme